MPGVIQPPTPDGDSLQALPFPVDCLPPILRDMATAIAAVSGMPLDMIGPCMLATASACLGNGIKVHIRPSYITSPNIFVLLVKNSGAGGSSAYRLATGPLRGFQADAMRLYDSETRPKLERRKATLTSDIAGMVKERGEARKKGEQDKVQSAEEELDGLNVELAAVEAQLVPPFYLVGDVTPERMAGIMEGRGGVMAHFDPDGSDTVAGLLGILYGKGEHARDTLHLKGYTGESVSISRQGSGKGNSSNVFIENPCISCLFVVTPDIAKKLTGSERMRDGGLLPRFLIAVSHSRPQPWNDENREIPLEVNANYERAAFALLNNYRNKGLGELLPIEAEAAARVVFAEHWLGFVDGYTSDTAAFEARHTENAMRLALVLHGWQCVTLSKHGETASVYAHNQPLAEQTARDAVQLLEWFKRHQSSILATQRGAVRDAKFDKVQEWCRKNGKSVIASRELLALRVAPDAKEAEQLLESWVTEAKMVKEEAEQAAATGGRPKGVRYRLTTGSL